MLPTRSIVAALAAALLLIDLAAGLAATATTAQSDPRSSLQRIQAAAAAGQIDAETALVYKVYSLFEPQRLPATLRGRAPGKSATPIVLEVQRRWQSLSPAARALIGRYPELRPQAAPVPRPAADQPRPILSGPEQTVETPHFVVHYTAAGEDTATAAFVQTVAAVMEYVLDQQVSVMGWCHPPDDSGEGGDSRYDLYLRNIPYYGYANYNGGFVDDNPHCPDAQPQAAYSYLVMDNDFLGFPGAPLQNAQVTGAHEYNHAIQFGYDADEPGQWLYEAVATWMEDEVYDDIDDNVRYLPGFFDQPDVCLSNNDPYGDWIFFRYISEHAGGQATVRAIWENNAATSGWTSVANALAAVGTSPAAVFQDFVAANRLLTPCPANAPYCYEEAALYPEAALAGSIDQSPALFSGQVDNNYAAAYVALVVGGEITVTVTGQSGQSGYRAQIIGLSGDTATVQEIALAGSPQTGSALVNADLYDQLWLAVLNVWQTASAPNCQGRSFLVSVTGGDPGPTPTPPPDYSWADFDGNCQVDVLDVSAVAHGWQLWNDYHLLRPAYDVDGDGDVDVRDVQRVAGLFGATVCAGTPQPAASRRRSITSLTTAASAGR